MATKQRHTHIVAEEADGHPFERVEDSSIKAQTARMVIANCGGRIMRNVYCSKPIAECRKPENLIGGSQDAQTITNFRTVWKNGVRVELSCGHSIMLATEANLTTGQRWACPDCPAAREAAQRADDILIYRYSAECLEQTHNHCIRQTCPCPCHANAADCTPAAS